MGRRSPTQHFEEPRKSGSFFVHFSRRNEGKIGKSARKKKGKKIPIFKKVA
jgi:hypothetical protein